VKQSVFLLASFGFAMATALPAAITPATAFDIKKAEKDGASPVDAFRAGTRFYYAGKKTEALSAFNFAAEKGHAGSQFALARMYARGEGVSRDDLKAFEYYRQVARHSGGTYSPGSKQARFIAKAYVAIGGYYMTGIGDSDIRPDVAKARDIFRYAASYFGDPEAQFLLARLYWNGKDAESDPALATRWFLSSARKGHLHAQATLGQALFYGEKNLERRPAHGLMWLSIARMRAKRPKDDWIFDAQERAFGLANEKQRRKAMKFAKKWVREHQDE